MGRMRREWLLKSISRFRGKRGVVTIVLTVLLVGGAGVLLAPRLYAAIFDFLYPPDKDIVFDCLVEPADYVSLGPAGTITVTVGIVNDETVDLHGFYYSDQVPNGWTVETASVLVGGASIADYGFEQGAEDEIYSGYTPHRWMLEVPQGDGVFSPAHPVGANGGTAQLVYRMAINGGTTGADYEMDYHGWAGWLAAESAGTAVYGYKYFTQTVGADFYGRPRLGEVPLEVSFTDLSWGGEDLTYTWDFGDGGSSSLLSPVYMYTATGTYTVSLTVQNSVDTHTMTRPAYIHVADTIYPVYLPIIMKSCSSDICQGDSP